jgi:hypothetical protein
MSSYDYDTNEITNIYDDVYDMSYLGNYVVTDDDIKVNQVEKINLRPAKEGEVLIDQDGNIYYSSRIVHKLRKDLLENAVLVDELLSLIGPGKDYNCGDDEIMRTPEEKCYTYKERMELARIYAEEDGYYEDILDCVNDAEPTSIFIK